MRRTSLRGKRLNGPVPFLRFSPVPTLTLLLLALTAAIPSHGRIKREKDVLQFGEGLIVNIPLPEPEVAQVVADVAQNTIIHGTKEYNKDEYVAGAVAATSTPVFPAWTEGGKVFYKVRKQALDPRNFKASGDVGTLAVRYVVQPQGEKNTILRIDALFVEDFRRVAHPSNGSVESAEYKDIQEHLEAIEVMKKQNAQAERERQELLEKKQNLAMQGNAPAPPLQYSTSADSRIADSEIADSRIDESPVGASSQPSAAQSTEHAHLGQSQPGKVLEDNVKDLGKQMERSVKAPGAPLKSAPFHTASTLQTLSTGTEVLILISTPYWSGVETHKGTHVWIPTPQL